LLIAIKIYTNVLIAIKIIDFLNSHQVVIFDSLIAIAVTYVCFVYLTVICLHSFFSLY
jgi:hypothetical protein